MEESEYIEDLKSLLEKSVEKVIKGKKSEDIAVAFSGGVDSALIAKLLVNFGLKPTAYVIGIKDCRDFSEAENAANELGLKLKKILLSEDEIKKELPVQSKILKKLYESNKEKIKPENPETKLNPVSVSSNFPLFFVEKYAKEKYVFSGLGADTILGGFAKYLILEKKQAEEELEKDTTALFRFDYLEDVETAKIFNKEILMPFLDKDLVEFCIKIPYELKINGKIRKYILRKTAEKIGLSKELAFKEKKSAQYGSGLMKMMKRVAKKEGMKISDYIRFVSK